MGAWSPKRSRVALIAVAPHWVTEDEARIGAAATAVEVAHSAPSDAGLAGGEGRSGCGGGEGRHEGDEGGGELHSVCFGWEY
jgi:hypothetical protein